MRNEPYLKPYITKRPRIFPDLLAVLEAKESRLLIAKRYENLPAPQIGSKFKLLPHTRKPFIEVRDVRHDPEFDLVELRFDPLDDEVFERLRSFNDQWVHYHIR